jgi:tetratricopeptide (TPR) repeat protein
MSRVPVVRQISWPAVLLQLAAVGGAIAVGVYVVRTSDGMILGAAVYLTYSIGSRMLIARDHRRGMRLVHNQEYAAAIQAFEDSYSFFARNTWIDRFRAVVMMSASGISYREMALCNIAFCHSQLGDGEKAGSYYRQALDEFPNSGLATAALRMIESARQQPTEPANGE